MLAAKLMLFIIGTLGEVQNEKMPIGRPTYRPTLDVNG